jgi:hypothetical protein
MNAMQACPDDAFEWIRTGRDEFLPRDDSNWRSFVGNLIPKTFDAYAKILHGIQARYDNLDNPLSDREISLLKIPPCTKLRSLVDNLHKQHQSSRIRWKTLAQLMNVPFAAEICHEWFRARMEEPGCWPRFLYGPDDGNLNEDELFEVLSVLSPFTGGQDCFFRFAEIPSIGTDKPILFRGLLDELSPFLNDRKDQFTPEYWWPADHNWCLCTDYDLTFTIVGGSRELIATILKNANLEALEVTPQTRIDCKAPIPQ